MYNPEDLFVVEEPAWHVDSTGYPLTCVDYSPNGALVAYSNQPGKIFISSSYEGTVKRTLDQGNAMHPIEGVRFHPSDDSLLLSASRDGTILLFNLPRGEIINRQRHLGSSLLAMNVDSFGEVFAIACADGSVRIYDMENLQRSKALVKLATKTATSQAVNIYSLIFHPEDSNILLAAGWNDRVIFWDLRTGNPERNLAGPHIRGPALDIRSDVFITGSARDKKQIELWDYGTTKKIRDININQNLAGGNILVNSLKVARNGMDIVAGGSGINIAQTYDYASGKCFGQSQLFQSPVAVTSVSPFGTGIIVGSDSGEISYHMIRIKPA
ncbi:hypothetical protein M9Y10_041209 [Tritrichomonas musculus]|uniref:Anaphase-promoting complex subunit 4 WD40 domain-containing protein n=1 Tax=Tritrichomonas musculus TaxID=1915356 RepID=A0ABR2K4T4_9EUKA